MSRERRGPDQSLAEALLHAQDAASRAFIDRIEAQRETVRAQAALDFVQESVSFRVGRALVDVTRSWRDAVALPGRLLGALRAHRRIAGTAMETEAVTPLPRWPGIDLLASMRAPPCPPATLEELRVAAVLDPFSQQVLGPECDWVNLPVTGFESILDEFAPHLLFVESAWRGHEGAWRNMLSPVSGNLSYLVDCCRRRGIPTVFWNKEDPAHFGHFLEAARLFDHVFTTDADCIPRYIEALGHSRVDTLAFACQPLLHGPIESGEGRRPAACFAGSWYRAYPERGAAFDVLMAQVGSVMPVAIYDRNRGRADPSFEFPARYQSLIQGSVPYAQLGDVYRSYEYAITVNSVQHSPTMLARRVYELLACNAVVVSNPTESVARLFDGIVVGATTDEDVKATLRGLVDHPGERGRRRLRGLRAVMSGHTAGHRMRQVCASVLGWQFATPGAQVLVVARVRTRDQVHVVKEAYLRQKWPSKRLCLLLAGAAGDPDVGGIEDAIVIRESMLGTILQEMAPQWLALMHPDDHYGPCYLQDLMLATAYAPAETMIGKSLRFRMEGSRCVETPDANAYRAGSLLSRRAMVERCGVIDAAELGRRIDRMEVERAPESAGLVIDGFEYCRDGAAVMPEGVDA